MEWKMYEISVQLDDPRAISVRDFMSDTAED